MEEVALFTVEEAEAIEEAGSIMESKTVAMLIQMKSINQKVETALMMVVREILKMEEATVVLEILSSVFKFCIYEREETLEAEALTLIMVEANDL